MSVFCHYLGLDGVWRFLYDGFIETLKTKHLKPKTKWRIFPTQLGDLIIRL